MAAKTAVAKPPVPRGSKLSLGFGLMTVPVQVKLLHETSKPVPGHGLCPVHGDTLSSQTLCCEGTPHEHVLASGEKVIGYPHPDDKTRYVPVDPDVLKSLEEQKTGVAQIEALVDFDSIDPVHIGQTFLVWSQPGQEQLYDLFCQALEGKAAVVSVVLRKQTQMIAFRWNEELGVLVGHVVRYTNEVRYEDVEKVRASQEERQAPADPQMLKLAKQVLETLGADEFAAGEVEDQWTPVLQDAIRAADDGRVLTIDVPTAVPSAPVDLMAALQASVAAAEPKPKKAAAKKKAAA